MNDDFVVNPAMGFPFEYGRLTTWILCNPALTRAQITAAMKGIFDLYVTEKIGRTALNVDTAAIDEMKLETRGVLDGS